MVKNSPAMQETRVQSLGWEDTLEKGMVTHSSIPTWRFHGLAKSWTQLSGFHFSLSGGISSKEPQVTKRPGFGPWDGKIYHVLRMKESILSK